MESPKLLEELFELFKTKSDHYLRLFQSSGDIFSYNTTKLKYITINSIDSMDWNDLKFIKILPFDRKLYLIYFEY